MTRYLVTFLGAAAIAVASSMPALADDKADLMKIENDWTQAVLGKDVKTLGKIVGDDWIGQGDDGTQMTKAQLLAGISSGDLSVTKETLGPMTARLVKGAGIVQGSDDEVSSYKGKDTSGKYTWMDVFAKRDGHWVAVASQNTKVTQ